MGHVGFRSIAPRPHKRRQRRLAPQPNADKMNAKLESNLNPTEESAPSGGAEGLEGDDGVGVLDARQHLDLLVDEVTDVGVVVDVELQKKIVVACGGIDFG